MSNIKKDAVTVSFHYFDRAEVIDGETTSKGFEVAEFDALASDLIALAPLDLKDERVQADVRRKVAVPVENVELVNSRTLFGVYRAAYWGHAYENTAVGKVPADSINLRKFYFILYLAKDGRLYLGVQYLGHYGSYEGIKNSILSHLLNNRNIVAHTFRQDSAMFEDVEPNQVNVTVARKGDDIATGSSFGKAALVTFKKAGRKDTEFADEVKRRLIPVMGTNMSKVQKAASAMVRDSGLMDVADDDIADCTVIGRIDGKQKTVYMMGQGLFATQFNIATTYDEDGIPHAAPTRQKMLETLEKRVIAVIADV
ncbi:MAG TPA: hypothetical protein VMQ93_15705 [Novosphingobium sp.]|nr:hypothetical protein [Novosphingobium sp.]